MIKQQNTNYYTAIFYIYISILLNTYWVKFEIIVMVFVSYKCTNGNILIFIRALWPTAGNGPQRKFGGSWDCHFKVQSVILLPVANLSEFILICNVLVMIKQQKILPLCQRSLFYLLFCWSQWQFKVLEHFIFPLVSKDICKTQWPRPPLFSLSWLIKWSMGEGSYITLFLTEWRHCVSQNKVWGRGCYITLFSPSDVTAFHRCITAL